jgi:predicted nucleic acid-binding protein
MAGALMAQRRAQGGIGELRDTMIAGIVIAHNATLATRNLAHFADLSTTVVNPWAA